MKSTLLGATRYLPKPAPNNVGTLSRYWSLWDNELIDDLSERFSIQITSDGTSYPGLVSNQKLKPTSKAYRSMETISSHAIKAGKQFCIQCKFNMTNAPDAFSGGLLAVWSESSTTENGWILNIGPDGSAALQISTTGSQTANLVVVSAPPGSVSFGVDHHIAVERDGTNKITLYIDGVAKGTAQSSVGSFVTSTRLTCRRGWVGSIWDISFSDGVVFGKAFTPPAKFPRLISNLKYDAAINADIVCQIPLRRDDPHCEVTGRPLQLAANAQVFCGSVVANTVVGDTYNMPVDYWGAGNFTYELKFRLPNGIPAAGVLLPSHWYSGAAANTDNRFVISVGSNGSVNIGFARSGTAVGTAISATSAAGVIRSGVDYHFVMERVGNSVKAYVDGVMVCQLTMAAPMWATAGNRLFGTYSGSVACRVSFWDLRIAKRALYNGVIVKPVVLPRMIVDYKAAVPKFKLRVGSLTGLSTSELRGFAKHVLYGGQVTSFGELFPQVFYHTTLNRMIRIKGIMGQAGSYMVFSCAYSNELRTDDTPLMTNTIKLGTQTFNMFGGAVPGMGNTGDFNFYSTGAGVWSSSFAADEALIDFSFV